MAGRQNTAVFSLDNLIETQTHNNTLIRPLQMLLVFFGLPLFSLCLSDSVERVIQRGRPDANGLRPDSNLGPLHRVQAPGHGVAVFLIITFHHRTTDHGFSVRYNQ